MDQIRSKCTNIAHLWFDEIFSKNDIVQLKSFKLRVHRICFSWMKSFSFWISFQHWDLTAQECLRCWNVHGYAKNVSCQNDPKSVGRIYFCIRRILSTNQCLILYTYLGVKSRKKFVYMKGQHNVEFCIHMSSWCNHLYTHFDLSLGH